MIDTVFPSHKSAHLLSSKEQGGSDGFGDSALINGAANPASRLSAFREM